MDQADFIHLVRESELACASDSAAYRRSVIWFAALGYLWVLGCLAAAIGLIGWVIAQALQGHFRAGYIWFLIVAGGLLWLSLGALWQSHEPIEDISLTRENAPGLFDALERIRQKIKGPPIHAVYLDDDFNARIRQQTRFGLLGGPTTNTLFIGLPFLMALDKARLISVLAHEYGHLRGDHGRFSSWIHRTRRAWLKLHHSMRNDDSPFAMATRAFVNWYFPRFDAKTFALARQDEYEADRTAARLLGKDVAAAALTEINIKYRWLHTEFWPQHWRGAAQQALPRGPFTAMQMALRLKPDPVFAQSALRTALSRISDADDTHPALRDRVEALTQARPTLPSWSVRGALSLLADGGARWIKHFDELWCKENASAWKLHHARLSRYQERVRALEPVHHLFDTALGRNRDACESLWRSLHSCAGKPQREARARFRPNPLGQCLGGRSAALQPLPIAGLLAADCALHPIPPRHWRGIEKMMNRFLQQICRSTTPEKPWSLPA